MPSDNGYKEDDCDNPELSEWVRVWRDLTDYDITGTIEIIDSEGWFHSYSELYRPGPPPERPVIPFKPIENKYEGKPIMYSLIDPDKMPSNNKAYYAAWA